MLILVPHISVFIANKIRSIHNSRCLSLNLCTVQQRCFVAIVIRCSLPRAAAAPAANTTAAAAVAAAVTAHALDGRGDVGVRHEDEGDIRADEVEDAASSVKGGGCVREWWGEWQVEGVCKNATVCSVFLSPPDSAPSHLARALSLSHSHSHSHSHSLVHTRPLTCCSHST